MSTFKIYFRIFQFYGIYEIWWLLPASENGSGDDFGGNALVESVSSGSGTVLASVDCATLDSGMDGPAYCRVDDVDSTSNCRLVDASEGVGDAAGGGISSSSCCGGGGGDDSWVDDGSGLYRCGPGNKTGGRTPGKRAPVGGGPAARTACVGCSGLQKGD